MDLLSLDTGMLVWLWVTFVGLAFILRKFAWGPLLKAVEDRENSIKDDLDRAESARADAEKLLAEHQQKLASAQEEMQQMMQDSKKMAEKMRNDIVQKANEEAQKLKERAKADLQNERDAAISALKKEVADLVVDATSKLVNVVVDKSKHQALIEESISQFGQKN